MAACAVRITAAEADVPIIMTVPVAFATMVLAEDLPEQQEYAKIIMIAQAVFVITGLVMPITRPDLRVRIIGIVQAQTATNPAELVYKINV